jgi:hypothetical protein
VPASLNGAGAALRCVRERYDIGQYPMHEEDGYRLLPFSTECVICATAGLAVPDRGRQGNRVKDSSCDEACKVVIVPAGGFAF